MQGRAQTLEVPLPARQRHRPQHRQGPYTNRVGVGVGVGGEVWEVSGQRHWDGYCDCRAPNSSLCAIED